MAAIMYIEELTEQIEKISAQDKNAHNKDSFKLSLQIVAQLTSLEKQKNKIAEMGGGEGLRELEAEYAQKHRYELDREGRIDKLGWSEEQKEQVEEAITQEFNQKILAQIEKYDAKREQLNILQNSLAISQEVAKPKGLFNKIFNFFSNIFSKQSRISIINLNLDQAIDKNITKQSDVVVQSERSFSKGDKYDFVHDKQNNIASRSLLRFQDDPDYVEAGFAAAIDAIGYICEAPDGSMYKTIEESKDNPENLLKAEKGFREAQNFLKMLKQELAENTILNESEKIQLNEQINTSNDALNRVEAQINSHKEELGITQEAKKQLDSRQNRVSHILEKEAKSFQLQGLEEVAVHRCSSISSVDIAPAEEHEKTSSIVR